MQATVDEAKVIDLGGKLKNGQAELEGITRLRFQLWIRQRAIVEQRNFESDVHIFEGWRAEAASGFQTLLTLTPPSLTLQAPG